MRFSFALFAILFAVVACSDDSSTDPPEPTLSGQWHGIYVCGSEDEPLPIGNGAIVLDFDAGEFTLDQQAPVKFEWLLRADGRHAELTVAGVTTSATVYNLQLMQGTIGYGEGVHCNFQASRSRT